MNATALLVMDVQQGIVERFAKDTGYLARLSEAIAAARAAGVPVVHRVLTEKVFPRQAAVRTVAEWAAELDGAPGD
jgi:nicotinamidase-related amidase